MKNPWMKKNPFLSMWLSGANAVAGSVRSRVLTETKRQSSAAVTQATKDFVDLWSIPGAAPSKRKRKRR